MKQADIQAMQRRIGVTDDGFWGPKSIAACQKHLRKLMPTPNPWPKTDQASLTQFYGKPGDESQHTALDVSDLDVRYEGNRVKTIRCHKKVAASLKRVLVAISKGPHAWVLQRFGGCYNNRPMRGGSLPSLHARAAATDWDDGDNGNLMNWPARATMPLEVMEEFAKEGWLSAGAFWSRDAMHFQATQ
jgi:hypothetical protein